MKVSRILSVAIVAAILSGTPANADDAIPSEKKGIQKFAAQILPSYEVPAILPEGGNPEATAFGVGESRLKVVQDSQGKVIEARARLKFVLCGLPGTSITFRKIDVHQGFVGQRGATVIDTPVSDSNPLTLPVEDGCVEDSLEGVAGHGTTLAETAAGIIANPAGFYFEVHTTPNNPNGLARGQLSPLLHIGWH